MIPRLLIILSIIILYVDCYADEPRIQTRFESKNGEYSVNYKNKKWIVKCRSEKVKYKIDDYGFTSMTIFISNDGQRIVVIDDFMQGQEIGNRNAIWIFTQDELIRTYKLIDLIKDTCNISYSIGHMTWCLEDFNLTNDEQQFYVSTNEFSDIVIDLITGKIVSNKKPDGFDSNTLIVFGKFYKGSEETSSLKVLRYIVGNKQENDIILIKTNHYGVGSWRQALMIKDGIDITPNRYLGKIFINSCLNE